METKLWNVWVQLSNGLDREIVFRGSDENAQEVRDWLGNREHIQDYGVSIEYADFDANDVIEEIASWIREEV